MLVLNEREVLSIIKSSFRTIIDVNRKALALLGARDESSAHYEVNVPTRIGISYNGVTSNTIVPTSTPADATLFKPAMVTHSLTRETSLGIKVASVRDGNSKIGKPIVPASIILLDAESGEVKAMIGGTYLTAARTAAGSACSTEIMCLPRLEHTDELFHNGKGHRSLELVCFGAGLQIELHIDALRQCRWPSYNPLQLRKLTIVNRSMERANSLRNKFLSEQEKYDDKMLDPIEEISILLLNDREEINQALISADIVLTATNTPHPLFEGKHVKKGAHVCGVGSYTVSVMRNSNNSSFVCTFYNIFVSGIDAGG